jgi:uroporphyrinogen III methyltransferase/synthase
MESDSSGKVFLVGAGPGAIDLITMRGAEILSRAQVVIYDSLVNPGLLRLAPVSATLIHAGKRGGAHKDLEQAEINAMLIGHARKGMAVVRLKGGDPFIFGRGGEEAEALAVAGIEFEVVPGITSAIAVPAFAGIPLTHREHGSFVAFVTGHEDESRGESSVPWDELAHAANPRGTIVILMATARLRGVLKRLADAGLPPSTPAAAIQWGTTASQKTVASTLAALAEEVERAKLGAPAVVVVGQCVDLRAHLKWAERMPLFGRRIVVTRASERVSSFARELRTLGAEVIEFPTIATVAPDSYATLDAAIARLKAFDWIIFTSATGVEAFIERLRSLQKDIRAMGTGRIAAIGPATAAALKKYALIVDAIPGEYRGEAIVHAKLSRNCWWRAAPRKSSSRRRTKPSHPKATYRATYLMISSRFPAPARRPISSSSWVTRRLRRKWPQSVRSPLRPRGSSASTWWWNRATIRFPRWLPPSAITSRRSGRQGSLILERWPPWHFR